MVAWRLDQGVEIRTLTHVISELNSYCITEFPVCYEQRFCDQRVIVPWCVILGSREKSPIDGEYRERIHDSQWIVSRWIGEEPEIVWNDYRRLRIKIEQCARIPIPFIKDLSSKMTVKRVSPFCILKIFWF